jgi:hypothetical protein
MVGLWEEASLNMHEIVEQVPDIPWGRLQPSMTCIRQVQFPAAFSKRCPNLPSAARNAAR